MTSLLAAAFAWHDAGCAVIPARTDGTKAPAVNWRDYQHTRPTPEQLHDWFGPGSPYDGLGIVCGAASGQLEMIEFESRAIDLVADLARLMDDHGLGEVWKTLAGGYSELTPSGGLHFYHRVDGTARRNMKLARRPGASMVEVLVETRGEGGFSVVAPSAGRTHATGGPWMALTGTPASIPTITEDDRDALHAVASMLDRMPAVDSGPRNVTGNVNGQAEYGTRPGDDYNARATWDDLLGGRGWIRVRKMGDGWAWRRPGKDRGISATTGQAADGVDRLYVFSSSTELEPERPYTLFAAYALLEHAGDYAAAALALRRGGYGGSLEQPRDLTGIYTPDDTPGIAATHHESPDQVDQNAAAPVEVVHEPRTYEHNDDGLALRLVDVYGAEIRHVAGRGDWLIWDGHRWLSDSAGTLFERARVLGRTLARTPDKAAKHRFWALSARGLTATLKVAQTDQRIVVEPRDLDARPYELNTPAGVVDLRTGGLRTPDQAALHTRSTAVAPDFNAQPTRWLRFLADTFAGDPDLTTYVQHLLGLSLIGEVREAVLPFAWGLGANGKSTLLNVAQHVMGVGQDGYAIPAPAEILLASSTSRHPTEIARLAGARLVVTSELEDGQRFAEARIKQLTGKDYLSAHFMRQDDFSWKPTHTIWLLANEQPAVRAGGPAFWRRLSLLPFLHTVPEAERIAGLDDLLVEEEGPAILGWMIRGAVDYQRGRLIKPASVLAATSAYETDQDTVGRFVDERCVLGEQGISGMAVRVSELRAAYEAWCKVEDETPVGVKTLTQTLRARFGVGEGRGSDRMHTGIRLIEVSTQDEQGTLDRDRGGW